MASASRAISLSRSFGVTRRLVGRRGAATLRGCADESGAIYEGTNNIQLETIAKLIRKRQAPHRPRYWFCADLDSGKEYVQ